MNFSIILLVLLLPTPLWVILTYKYFQNKKSEKNARLTELQRKSEYIQSVIDKLDDSGTNATKLIAIKKALIVLEDCETFDECRNVIRNYDELKNHLHSLQKEYQF